MATGQPTFHDIPAFSQADLANPAAFVRKLEALREQLQLVIGTRGPGRGNPAWFNQLVDSGLLDRDGGRTPAPPGSGDSTPPPVPAGLIVTPGLNHVFVEWDAATYGQGGGNAYTTIYGVSRDPADTSPPPTFSSAVELATVPFSTAIYALPSAPNVEWHIWITFTTYANVEGPPAGGTNGATCTTAKIGNTNLGDLIISAEKLSAGTYSGLNMVPNPGSEDGLVAWVCNELTAGGGLFDVSAAQKWSGSQSFRLLKTATADGVNAVSLAIPVIPGETYAFRMRVHGGSATASGLYVRLNEMATKPAGNYVTSAVRTSFTNIVNNGAVSAGWSAVADTYTVPAGVFWVSIAIYNWINGPLTLHFDDLSLGRQIVAESLAAGCIAVGTLAVQNGALVNAMIGNLQVDDAKIVNMSAAKITAGSIAVGEYIQSSGFVSGFQGFRISGNGNAEFNNAVFRGLIEADSGLIGGLVIDTSGVESTNYVAGSAGFRLDNATGTLYANDIVLPVGLVTESADDAQAFTAVTWPNSSSAFSPYPATGAGAAHVSHTYRGGIISLRADLQLTAARDHTGLNFSSISAVVKLVRKASAGAGVDQICRSAPIHKAVVRWQGAIGGATIDNEGMTGSATLNFQYGVGDLTTGTSYYFALAVESIQALDGAGFDVAPGADAFVTVDAYIALAENKV